MTARRKPAYRPAPPPGLPPEQRRRLRSDLDRLTHAAQVERFAAVIARRVDNDEAAAQAAEARAVDRETEADSIRTVLTRFPAQPSKPFHGSGRYR